MNPLKTLVFVSTGILFFPTPSFGQKKSDPYENYIQNSKDFKPVKQEKDLAYQAFPGWLFMPWTAQWHIGYNEQSAAWCREQGYNGAFIDRSDIAAEGSPTGRLDWINKNRFRFYVDHAADKGLLHLWDGDRVKPYLNDLHGTGVRTVPLNETTRKKLQEHLRRNITAVKSSAFRAAYALDDESSWGHFVHPTMWQITDDKNAYANWLKEIYGPASPKRDRWISYEEIRPQLARWKIQDFDASPLMDQWTFNDAYWSNYLGDLVEYANKLDPHTPCGIVGGQAPSAFGGYDYARLMRKVQFLESYNLGSSQAIIRSFNPHNALPAVTTLFHKSSEDDIWQTWYYLAHGNRGHIAWVEGWFDGKTPKAWHKEVAPTFKEAGEKIGPLMAGSEWIHDGVAIYYSHPSIQLGWILDAEAHGKTWVNRNGDERLASASHVRHAWENMLRDSGIQYSYINYVDVIQKGIPREFKVLILPACLCLSDGEARRIKEFCRDGGTVIADYLPGLWDQHGKGRTHGVLDDLFGVNHPGNLTARDLFGGKLWVEVDQDANFSWKTYQEFLTNQNHCLRDSSGFNKAVRSLPVNQVKSLESGKAILMNLSTQWYNAYRVAGVESARKREIFMKPIAASGVVPRVRLKETGDEVHGYEITYWNKKMEDGKNRTMLFLCFNPEITGTSLGGGNSQGLKTATLPVTFQFRDEIRGLTDERTGKQYPAGREFPFPWKQNEAVVVSFASEP
ncbi:beta-galactosidase trimerization domain-containing protein [Telmatocola sphagniphila]|uniref:Beta-galactosidase trimerization domain-containing protein n=1 Tax=Telmatocola sphagniphila TaxID=1123043 RepID=A0A8E6ES06_9BACT|nr:beta-galactosidase trimerization domain-containing protein [Telmatocola sphagniphila]QVL29929.1 beta-galactosidase trimerization domain-containing protein [Telmatocola sphagniphila]